MPQSTAKPPASEAGTRTAEGPQTEADCLRMLEGEPGKALLSGRLYDQVVTQDLLADGSLQASMRDIQTQHARHAVNPLLSYRVQHDSPALQTLCPCRAFPQDACYGVASEEGQRQT